MAASDASLVSLDRATAAAPVVTLPLALSAAVDLGSKRWLAVVIDAAGRRWSAPLIEKGGAIARARAGDGVAEAVLALLARGWVDAPGVTVASWQARQVVGEQPITVDQTNDSVVVGDPTRAGEAAVVKWLVHQPAVGAAHEHPAVRRLRVLADAGFAGMPAPWGLVTMDVGERASLLVATVVEQVPEAADGWTWAVEDVCDLARGEWSMPEALSPVTELGALTARMHLAFAHSGVERATDADAHRWVAQAGADLDLAVASVEGPEGVRLRNLAPRVKRALGGLRAASGTGLIDVHGDLHVGQILRHGHPPEYLVIDFDGNPVVPEQERAAKQPAALDVAGMLASLDHVGRVVTRRTEGVDEDIVTRWISLARQEFLAAYRSTLAAAGQTWLLDELLLHPLLVAQEVREYLYAVQHLPHWIYVPGLALPALLEDH